MYYEYYIVATVPMPSPRVPSPPTIPPLSTVKGKIIKCDLSECPNVSLGTLHHDRVLTLAGTETED